MPAPVDDSSAIVEFAGEPLSVSPRTKPERGARIDFASTNAKNERARLAAVRNDFRAWLRATQGLTVGNTQSVRDMFGHERQQAPLRGGFKRCDEQ